MTTSEEEDELTIQRHRIDRVDRTIAALLEERRRLERLCDRIGEDGDRPPEPARE